MRLSANAVLVREILPWRGRYRAEMQCQIVHGSLYTRSGWTQSDVLRLANTIIPCVHILVGPLMPRPA